MTRSAVVRAFAFTSLAVLLLVIGAALRPLLAPVNPPVADPVLNATEIGFIQDMAAHHQQAVQIVQRLDPDVDPGIAALARQIRDAQSVEIGTFLGWLRLAEAPPTNRQPMSWMFADTTAAHKHSPSSRPADSPTGLMPGMATMTELDGLASARGHDAEVLFLQLMYRHHLGGVEMARAADALLTHGPVKQAARDIMATQSQEAGLMAAALSQNGP
ncbi:DUF305 domain-containing protein [Rhodococcus sp. ARC_M6]|uniref:DUF305 domain-containing protein n=1 Tax=Rhodococcus sp. ARC_M6 TaxID=2928852 RepID=UPI001FB4303B|nr:DUF305 domain-containing protein [Rhodococcus sp. ARC_M6]MCJ0905689.1 DUF305 domain-containing protein [Rhodococcus sp. ARC_M6]